MRVSAQCVSQRSRYACACPRRFEALAMQRRLLRVADAGFDLALAIGIADAARQADDAVVREHVAVERIERRLVDIGREHALFEIVEDDRPRGPAETAKRALVERGPRLRTRLPRQQPHGFARVRKGQDKEPRPAVLARLGMADHRAFAVVDLRLFARRGGDDDARVRRRRAPECPDEAADTRIPRGEADVIDEVLPDRHRIAADAARAASMRSRWGSHALARGARDGAESVDTTRGEIAGFARGSVDTSGVIAAFAVPSLGRPRPRTARPAARR